MNAPPVTVRSVEDESEATRLAAARLEELVSEALALRERAHVALCGGATPRPAYELLAERIGDPAGLELWFGDERAVGPADDESNFRMVNEAFGEALEPEAIHRIEGERGPEEAADRYAALLAEGMPKGADGLPVLDVAFQGVGPDGHTASLFPGNPAVEADGLCVPVHDAPKPPPERVTMTVPVLRAARRIVFLVTGDEKAEAIARMLETPDPRIPASLLTGPRTELIADRAALSRAELPHG
jgi:6-phosphogluconolactonase